MTDDATACAAGWMGKLLIIYSLSLTSCWSPTGDVSFEERAWANAPDGRTHAILTETNGGATTAFGYLVDLHPSDHQGEKPVRVADLYRVSSNCEYGLDMEWIDANTLALRFDTAAQMKIAKAALVGGKRIRVVVKRGVEASDANPCRGMIGRPRNN